MVRDKPLELIGKAVQAVRNRVVRKREPLTDLPQKLLHERDTVVRVLGDRWWEALLFASGRWVLDYLTLLAALYAVGAEPRASLVLLAFFAAQLLGTLPLTPAGSGSSRRASPERSRSPASPRARRWLPRSPTGSSRSGCRSPRAESRRSSTNESTAT